MKKEICHAYKTCGGCTYMGVAYQEQLFEKRKYIQSLFPKEEVGMVVGMEDPYHYRNKVYATFGYDKDENLIAGMYEENSHDLVFVPDCLIQNDTANQIVASLVKNAGRMKIEPYNEDTGKGVLRHCYIRVSHSTGKALVVIVIGAKQLPSSRELVQDLLKDCPQVDSIVLNWNSENTSMILGPRERVIYGSGFITDEIGGLKFRIGSRSFYQVNPVQTEKLYAKAIELAGLTRRDTVLDACCGIGTISLFAAKKAKEVVGVEINESSIRDAVFYCDNARTFLERLMDTPDVVILDPPRAGMGYHFMSSLSRLGSRRIVYISCNPKSQADDIACLHGYRIKAIVPVDMFPFTKHIENIVVLEKSRERRNFHEGKKGRAPYRTAKDFQPHKDKSRTNGSHKPDNRRKNNKNS